jgi:aryl carrier-like protein
MRTHEQTTDEILDLAAAHFKVPRENLSPDDDFFKKLGIDSLQALSLLTRLEQNCRALPISEHWRSEFRQGCRIRFHHRGERHRASSRIGL